MTPERELGVKTCTEIFLECRKFLESLCEDGKAARRGREPLALANLRKKLGCSGVNLKEGINYCNLSMKSTLLS